MNLKQLNTHRMFRTIFGGHLTSMNIPPSREEEYCYSLRDCMPTRIGKSIDLVGVKILLTLKD